MIAKEQLRRLDELITAQKTGALREGELDELAAIAGAVLAEHADLATAANFTVSERGRALADAECHALELHAAADRYAKLLARAKKCEDALAAVLAEVAPIGVTGGRAVRDARALLQVARG